MARERFGFVVGISRLESVAWIPPLVKPSLDKIQFGIRRLGNFVRDILFENSEISVICCNLRKETASISSSSRLMCSSMTGLTTLTISRNFSSFGTPLLTSLT